MTTRDIPPVNPNALTPRAAMGQPETFVERLSGHALTANKDLLGLPAWELVYVLESLSESPARRFAAGAVLAILGDPRIDTFAPQMVFIPGGRAQMGLPLDQVDRVVDQWRHVGVERSWIEKECPDFEVRLEDFAIARFAVTNDEFREFLIDTRWPELPTSWPFGMYPHQLANHPAWTVTPAAADAYVRWLSDRTGRAFRLPSEVEWEFVSSNGEGRQFPWGDLFDPLRLNTAEAGPLTTTPVGMYPLGSTPQGVADLGGNVEEYVADNYSPYAGGIAISDDLALSLGRYRVARGGSFSRYGDLARSTRRHGWFPSPIYAMGFRLAETPASSKRFA